jgi:hypothetical protein
MKKEKIFTTDTPIGSLIPYYIQNPLDPLNPSGPAREYWCYNDIVKVGDINDIVKADNMDPFQLNVNNDIQLVPKNGRQVEFITLILVRVLGQTPSTCLNTAIQAFRTALEGSDWAGAWSLLTSYDACSTRSFLEG